MTSTAFNASRVFQPPRSHRPAGVEPVRVMLVTGVESRGALLRASVDRKAPGCHIEVVNSCFDAMARASRMPAHLMVLDMSVGSVLVPALKHFLAQSAPQVALHVFDDSGDPPSPTEGFHPAVIRLQTDLQAFIDGQCAGAPLNH